MSTCCSAALWILFCNLCVSSTIGSFIRKPENTEVVRGFNVSILCSISFNGDRCAEWYHTPLGTSKRSEVFKDCLNIKPYYPRFKVSRDDAKGEYNLTISEVDYADAGTYVCVYKYGEEAQAELTVLESSPNGILNGGSEPLVICGNKTQAVSFSCDVGYRGRIEPILYWQQLSSENVIDRTNVTSFASAGRVVSKLTVAVNYSNIDSIYICKTKLSQFNWTSEKLNIQYAVRVSPEETNIKASEQEFCEIDTNVLCKNRVVNEDGKIVLYSECRNSSNDIFCRFNCEFPQRTGSPNCIESKAVVIGLAVTIGIMCMTALVAFLLWKCRPTDKCKQWRARSRNRNRQRRDIELTAIEQEDGPNTDMIGTQAL